jgi:hypothetical protein
LTSTCTWAPRHLLRATGITVDLNADGTFENAQAMAPHEIPQTTKLYGHMGLEITIDKIERIAV